jgi:hypothetical protein
MYLEQTGWLFFGFGLICLAILLYFLPTAIASRNKHPYGVAIFVLNLFAGWTFIGWLAALVWSLARPQAPQIIYFERDRAS